MSQTRSVLVLHEPGELLPELASFIDALKAQGAQVEVLACSEPYAQVLHAVASADTVVFWR